MNLYKIVFSHSAPKDTSHGIKTYLLANNDDEVYDYIDREYAYGVWSDTETDNEIFNVYDDDYNVIGNELFHGKIIRLKGDINDDDVDFADAYYGITLYGWEIIESDTNRDFSGDIELGMVTQYTPKK
jgi:hypothetical protein